jgi:hypothetical protein
MNQSDSSIKLHPDELPPRVVTDVISESIDHSVTDIIGAIEAASGTAPLRADAKIKGRCLYYTAAAWYVNEIVLEREYHIQIGSLEIQIASNEMLKIDSEAGGLDARSFHMWLAAEHVAGPELVDLTSRFFKLWAVQIGAQWTRPDLPDYLWDHARRIADKYQVNYKTNTVDAEKIQPMLDANDQCITAIVERSLDLINQRRTW